MITTKINNCFFEQSKICFSGCKSNVNADTVFHLRRVSHTKHFSHIHFEVIIDPITWNLNKIFYAVHAFSLDTCPELPLYHKINKCIILYQRDYTWMIYIYIFSYFIIQLVWVYIVYTCMVYIYLIWFISSKIPKPLWPRRHLRS